MLKIGLTGGIGSGKSTVASIFSSFGIPVYIADDEAKRLMNSDIGLKSKITKLFGTKAYVNNQLDNSHIAKIVFKNPEKLKLLTDLVHPSVGKDFNNWCTTQTTDFVIEEAAVLIESGAYKKMDKIIVVTTPEEIRIERVMKRDCVTMEKVKQRIANQMDEKQRLGYADFVINNDGSHLLIPQVMSIITQLKISDN